MTNYLQQNSNFMTRYDEGFDMSYGTICKKAYDCRIDGIIALPLVLVEVAPGCKLSTVYTGNNDYNLLACAIEETENKFYDTVLDYLPYTHYTERVNSIITKTRKNQPK